MKWNPWRAVRGLDGVSVDTRWQLPDGQSGAYDEGGKTIYLCRSLTQTQRRSALTHEMVHVHRGSPEGEDWLIEKEERAVDQISARLLIDLDALMDALSWCQGRAGAECADEVWADLDTLSTRIATLTETERAQLEAEFQRRS